MAVDDAFKEEEHPFRIAIVCAMWLTGFDVPSLATLYLDKPLKAHTLMQAIARANRVNQGKNNGLIVDYCGILKHLRKALATFAGTRPGNVDPVIDPARPDEELLDDLAEAIALVRAFLEEGEAPLDDVIRKSGFKRKRRHRGLQGSGERERRDPQALRGDVPRGVQEVQGLHQRAGRQQPPGGSRRYQHRLQEPSGRPRAGRHLRDHASVARGGG